MYIACGGTSANFLQLTLIATESLTHYHIISSLCVNLFGNVYCSDITRCDNMKGLTLAIRIRCRYLLITVMCTNQLMILTFYTLTANLFKAFVSKHCNSETWTLQSCTTNNDHHHLIKLIDYLFNLLMLQFSPVTLYCIF